MILGVHHPALSVPDLDRALEFYCGVLGFEPVMQAQIPSGIDVMSQALGITDSSYKVAMLKKGNSCIELFEFLSDATPASDPKRSASQLGISHICLATDDYEQDFDRLRDAGVEFNSEPMGAAPGRWAYGRDPFGNIIELLEHDPSSPAAQHFDP